MDDLSTRTCESELSNKPTVSLQHDRSTQEEQRGAPIPGNMERPGGGGRTTAAASLASLVTLLPLSLASSAMQQRASAWEESAAAAGMEQVDLRSCSGRVFIVRPSLGLSWHGVCLLSFLFIYLFLFLGNAICLFCCWWVVFHVYWYLQWSVPPFSYSVTVQNC